MHAKNPYHLMFGPADERGVMEVTDAELIAEARTEQTLALMDYAAFPEEWTGEIWVEIIDLARLERVREAIGIYGAVNYQPGIETRLSEYEVRLREVSDSTLSVSLRPSDERR